MTGLTIAVVLLATVAVIALAMLLAVWRQLAELRRRVDPMPQQLADLAHETGQVRHTQRLQTYRAEQDRASQRRFVARASRERRAAERRHQLLASELAQTRAGVETVRTKQDRLPRLYRDQLREVEAMLQLFDGVSRRAPMPPSGNWALNPTDLLELWSVLEQQRPKQVLELGSGTSSVWLGYALEQLGGRLVSVDHDPQFGGRTREQLRRHGLEEIVEVRDAPLRPVSLTSADADEEFPWYDPEVFTDLVDVDLLLVDGPPGKTRPLSRLPALPMLRDRLAAQAVVVLDDAQRPDEQEIVRQWRARYPEAALLSPANTKLAVLRLGESGEPPQ